MQRPDPAPDSPVRLDAPDATAATAAPGPRADRALVAITAVAVVVGVALRFWPRSGMWLDEALTANIASLPLGEIGEALRRDGHPPLFYLLLHWWMAVGGESDGWIRALSGVISLIALPLSYLAAARLAGRSGAGPLGARRTGLIAMAIMAVLPYGVRYGAEARMYSLTITLVLAGYLLVDGLLSGSGDRSRRLLMAAGVALVAAGLLWNHYWSMWLLAAVGLLGLWMAVRAPEPDQRAGARLMVGGLVIGGFLFLPWIPSLMYQSANTGTPWGERFGPASVVVISLVDFAGARHGAAQLLSYILVPLVLMAASVRIRQGTEPLVISGRVLPRIRSELAVMALAMGVGWAAAFATDNTFASRYAAIVYPLFVLCVAAGTAVVRSSLATSMLLVAVLGLSAFGAVGEIRFARSQTDSIADEILLDVAAHDVEQAVVIACPDQLGVALQRKLDQRAEDAPVVLPYPSNGDPRFVNWVDYGARNKASDPQQFVSGLGDELPEDATVYFVSNTTYRTFEGKCEQLAAVLNQGRVGAQLQSSKSDDHEEPAGLLVLRPTP